MRMDWCPEYTLQGDTGAREGDTGACEAATVTRLLSARGGQGDPATAPRLCKYNTKCVTKVLSRHERTTGVPVQ